MRCDGQPSSPSGKPPLESFPSCRESILEVGRCLGDVRVDLLSILLELPLKLQGFHGRGLIRCLRPGLQRVRIGLRDFHLCGKFRCLRDDLQGGLGGLGDFHVGC
ncbi:hypothetical protein V2J09_003957 [Rumex salicifolius]